MQIANLLTTLLDVYLILLLARVLLSWTSMDSRHPVVHFVWMATEPVLGPIRSIIGVRGSMDFSPIVAVLLISFLRRLVMRFF